MKMSVLKFEIVLCFSGATARTVSYGAVAASVVESTAPTFITTIKDFVPIMLVWGWFLSILDSKDGLQVVLRPLCASTGLPHLSTHVAKLIATSASTHELAFGQVGKESD